jgi:hypothetical protein
MRLSNCIGNRELVELNCGAIGFECGGYRGMAKQMLNLISTDRCLADEVKEYFSKRKVLKQAIEALETQD